MSSWNHACCEACWIDREGEWVDAADGYQRLVSVRIPTTLVADARTLERCCFCSKPTIFGCYVRSNPSETPCEGQHDSHDGTSPPV